MGDVWESGGVVEEVWQSSSTPGVEWRVIVHDNSGGGGGADLSDDTPAALGVAAAGIGAEASRSDHVHGLPSAADVGAAAVSHQHSASDVTSGVLDDARIPSSVARDSEVSQAVSDHDGSLTAHPDIRAAIPDPQFMRVTAIVSDETDAIVFGDPAPDDADAVLVFGRSSGDGVYSMSTVDGWELLDPQPTLVASDDLLDWVSGEPFWTGGATWFNYTAGGWQLVGSTPNLAEGNASSVWTPTGWRSGFPDPTGATAGHVWTADGLDAAEWAAPSAAGGADLSDTTPQALGTAAAGDGTAAARDDHVHAMPTAADVGAIATSEKGASSGVAELDSGGKVPSSQLPSYVDDIVEAANFAALPGTGETGKIYVTLDDNLTYRWSGSAYVEVSASLALGETSSTAYRGDRGKTAYDHSQIVSGNPHGTTAADVGADPAGTAAGLVDDLSGVSNQATARTNLGLGSAAVEAASAFATAAQGVDARTPTAHKTSHQDGGTDELALDASQITTGTVATARLGSGTADSTTFLAGDQTYKTVSSGLTLISDTTLGSTAASVELSSIPNTYKSLIIHATVRCNEAGVDLRNMLVRFNSDTGSNYNYQFVGGNNSTAFAGAAGASSSMQFGVLPAATATAGYATQLVIQVHNYASTVFFKNAHFQGHRDTNGAAANAATYAGHGTWRSTAAITSITLFPNTSSFIVGTRVTLWGAT